MGTLLLTAAGVATALGEHLPLNFGQVGWNGGRAALCILVTSQALLPSALLATLHRLPPRTTILTRGEVGVLEHLRQEAPLDAVVAHLWGASRSELRSPTGLRAMPLVAAFAGRRPSLSTGSCPCASRARGSTWPINATT